MPVEIEYLNASGGELYANGRLGLQIEFIAGKPRQQVGLANTRVTNQHNCNNTSVRIDSIAKH
jgi:hypothetical protein